MSIRRPPVLPPLTDLPKILQEYMSDLDEWTQDVYDKFSLYDTGKVRLSSEAAVPTGGEDGDVYVRVAGVNTALYLNINGAFSAFTNP